MRAVVLALAALLGAFVRLGAAEVTDLGDGLVFLRVHALVEALKPAAGNRALVLDLRNATVTAEARRDFAALLARPLPEGRRLFLLVGPDTPAELADALKPSAGVITLGVRGARPEPQVVVDQSPEDDRRACAALDAGQPIAELVSGKLDKDHFDEAQLVREFKNGNHDAHPAEGNPDANASPAPRPTDRVLQRAVHLHRALAALRR